MTKIHGETTLKCVYRCPQWIAATDFTHVYFTSVPKIKLQNSVTLPKLAAITANSVMKMDCNREYFTRHGLHLNMASKEVFREQIAATCIALFQLKKEDPISLCWNDYYNKTDTVICSITNINGNQQNITNMSQWNSQDVKNAQKATSYKLLRFFGQKIHHIEITLIVMAIMGKCDVILCSKI